MKVYNISGIIDIDNEKLTYVDENGKKLHIYFNECRLNWFNHVNNSNDFITYDGKPVRFNTISETTCIGTRDWFSDKPYIEFYTNPLIRFEINPKRKIWDIFNKSWKRRYYNKFSEVREKIAKAGWTTFDLG